MADSCARRVSDFIGWDACAAVSHVIQIQVRTLDLPETVTLGIKDWTMDVEVLNWTSASEGLLTPLAIRRVAFSVHSRASGNPSQ